MNPVGAVFVAVGYWKMCGIITAKLSAIGAKFGALAGTAGSIVGACLDALTGAAIAGTIFDQLCKERESKKIFRLIPYGVDISVR